MVKPMCLSPEKKKKNEKKKEKEKEKKYSLEDL